MTSNGDLIKAPLAGAGARNPLCTGPIAVPNAIPEDPESVGMHVSFGRFTALHLGDLTSDKESAQEDGTP